MSYIGNPIVSTDFPVDYKSGNGSTTAFTLSVAPASVNSIDVQVSGVSQSPQTYSVSGTTLTFSAAPPTGTNNIVVRHKGIAGIPNTPSTASVVTASIAANAVTPAKMANGGAEFGMRNRIINGDMRIDQRNAGASVTPTGGYTLDRWYADRSQASKYTLQQNAGSVTPPAGFTNYLGITSSSAYTVLSSDYFYIQQPIEGFNVADLDWGTANAKTVTISAWVRSSLTGTFGGAIRNSGVSRSYPFSYTISSANTWEYKTITIAGDTSGTWLTTNGIGLQLAFNFGAGSTFSGTAGAWASANYISATGATSVVGTSGATFYITGVQLEVGSSATGFEYVNYQTSLANCQRYYYKVTGGATTSSPLGTGFNGTTTTAIVSTFFPVTMRTDPTALEQSGTAGEYRVRYLATSTTCSSVPTFFATTQNSAATTFTVASGLTAGQGCIGGTVTANTGYLAWSAEL